MADDTDASAPAVPVAEQQQAAAAAEPEQDPRVWKEVSTALESYKDVEVRNWTRELVLTKTLLDDRLFRCHPLTELTIEITTPLKDTLTGVGYLKNLVTLVVRNCGLTELPRSIKGCVALKNLDCSHNPDLTYLPEELCLLPHLTSVRACDCGLETLRDLEAGCPKVSQLFLNTNLLTELDGPTIANFTNLKHFEAAENAIDEIPAEIASLAKTLQVLDLNDNAITEIPQAFGTLKKLVRINLSKNEISNKQMLRVVKDATEQGAKKLKNLVTHCKKKGVKTKPMKGNRPKFVRVTRAEAEAAAKAAAEAAEAAEAAAQEARVSGDATETKEEGWGDGANDDSAAAWGEEAALGGAAKSPKETVMSPKEQGRQERKLALKAKRAAAAAERTAELNANQADAEKIEKQREAERLAELEKRKALEEMEAAAAEKKLLEEQEEQKRFDALPEEEKAKILAGRKAEAEKEEAERQRQIAENKALRAERAAKEAARDQAQKAEAEKANAEALKAAEAAARSKLEANKRCLGTVMKFSPKGFGIIQDAESGKKLFMHISSLMHEAQSVSVQAMKRKTVAVGTLVEYTITPPVGRQPLAKAISISLPGFKPFPLVFT